MKIAIVIALIACAIATPCPTRGDKAGPLPAFSKAEWETRVTNAWNRKDAKLVGGYISKLYNDAGVSREEAIEQAADIFRRHERIDCRYRILWFKQFADPTLASAKFIMEIKGVPKGGKELAVLKQTMGYNALRYENGEWKLYGVMFFCDPRVPSFDFDKEKGNWPQFDSQIHLVDYDPGNERGGGNPRWRTHFDSRSSAENLQAPAFDKTEWETRIAEGWNRKDAATVLSCFSKLYNEVGLSREDATAPVKGFFEKFDKLFCRYRVLAFKPLPGTNLASIKAVMEMSGVPAGGKQAVKFIQTMGYASLIFEDGQWRMYCSQLFYSPKVPAFNFDEEKGNWPPWGTVVDLTPR
ncbi:MAG TPA: hypothetical protein VF762_09960 [Blastocatellia bacterium]|jgi:hypothetical protein